MFNFKEDRYKYATLVNLAATGVACYTGESALFLWVFLLTGFGLWVRSMRMGEADPQ